MDKENQRLIHNFVDETLMVTPKPNACSTAEKNLKRTDTMKTTHNWEDTRRSSSESLGILSLNEVRVDSNTLEDCDSRRYSEFDKQKQLALNLLNRTQNVGKLPSQYLVPSSTLKKDFDRMKTDESTINESDLFTFLDQTHSKNSMSGFRENPQSVSSIFSAGKISELFGKSRPSEFTPHENSTPRTSEFLGEYSKKLEEITNKIVNTDISMSEVLKDFRFSEYPQLTDISDGSFVPSELAAEKLKADELSWMKEHGSLVFNDLKVSDLSSFIKPGNDTSGKISEFFSKKSENISDLNLNPSPEKQNEPYPLIDTTGETTEIEAVNNGNKNNETLDETFNIDTFNLTLTLQKMLSSNEDTKHLLSMICKKGPSKNKGNNDESESPKVEKQERNDNPIREQDFSKVRKDGSSRFSLQNKSKEVNNSVTKKSLPVSPLRENNYQKTSPLQNIDKNNGGENKTTRRISDKYTKDSRRDSDAVKKRLNRAFLKFPQADPEKHRNSGSLVPIKLNKYCNENENKTNNSNRKEPPTRDTNIKPKKFQSSPLKDQTAEKYCNGKQSGNYLEIPTKDIFQSKSRTPEKKSPSQIPHTEVTGEEKSLSNNSTTNELRSFSLNSCYSGMSSDDKSSLGLLRFRNSLNNLPDGKVRNEKQITNVSYSEIPTKAIFQNKSRTPEKMSQLQTPHTETGITGEKFSLRSNSPTTNELRSFSPNSCYSGISDDKSSRGSVQSGSSLDNLPDGKLPIESTHIELVWGCVKVGKKSTQEFILRNRSQQKVRLEASVTGSSFKILRDGHDSELRTNVQLILYPNESRTISVSFFPTSIGAAAEQLNFFPADKSLHSQYSSKQMIWLFGYGGHANVELQNITKDTNRKYWLSLGNIAESSGYIKTFEIKNLGTLPAFNVFQVECRGLKKYSNINVNPSHVVIRPNEVVEVSISFYPNKDDLKQIMETINRRDVELAYLSIISGPEPLRGRIRRLRKKISEQVGFVPDYPIVETLTDTFPGEQIPQDVARCKESSTSMKELLKHLSHKEIVVTMEQDTDQTLVGNLRCLDDSSHFLSLSHNERTVTVFEATSRLFGNFSIEPDKLFLSPPRKVEDSFLITCEGEKEIYFEIIPDDQDLLQCNPQSGSVLSGEPIFVVVRCNCTKIDRSQILSKIKVYVENEVAEVTVKIVLIQNIKALTNYVT